MATQYGAVSIKNDAEDDDKDRAIEMPLDDSTPKCRDPIFVVLFIAHLAGMVAMSIKFGSFKEVMDVAEDSGISEEDQEEYADIAQSLFLHVALPSSVISFIFGLIITSYILPANTLLAVKTSVISWLIVTIGIMIATAIMVETPWAYVGTVPLVALSIVYVFNVWKLVPFAAVNLKIALKGMSSNWGVYIIGIIFSFVTFFWVVFWFYVVNGFWNQRKQFFKDEMCDTGADEEGLDCEKSVEEIGGYWGIMFLFLVSLYWTITVILNTVRVTVAGVMATWCFDKDDATTCCSPAVISSLVRAILFSFGSICFGSLLEAIVTALRVIVERMKEREDADGNQCDVGSILLCIAVCILRCIENIVEYFNQWAYIYVGIYGYSYLESGKKVIELFKDRGWTALFTTDLASHVLMFTTIFVGIITGLIGILIDIGYTGIEGEWDSFVVGLIVALFICHVMMSVILGAVNTVIVCFAESPEKLAENHPELTREMAEIWSDVFPECGALGLLEGGEKLVPAVV
uniref:Choline transporter-like protein n=1 Tax=Helicotheca tamesis TaxID=374047 RepID=A0A7S2HDT4_9STRA|mmetsp:Transcript_17261/g.23761  ORF Transcript_17261/g.23761 Transcript_17261/m.23761 type:complete len:517 (+) Transcript_17261:88-1638(+)